MKEKPQLRFIMPYLIKALFGQREFQNIFLFIECERKFATSIEWTEFVWRKVDAKISCGIDRKLVRLLVDLDLVNVSGPRKRRAKQKSQCDDGFDGHGGEERMAEAQSPHRAAQDGLLPIIQRAGLAAEHG